MDFPVLFEAIGLWEQGKAAFWRLQEQLSEETVAAARAAFEISDEAFGSWLTEHKGTVSARELTMYFYLLWSEEVMDYFRSKGMEEEVFCDSMVSMAQACRYCYESTGVYGIEQKLYRPWFRIFLLEKRLFRFGRLEFELTQSKHSLFVENQRVQLGQNCLYVHIPRYAPLHEEECQASFARAEVFFQKHFAMENFVCFCRSWLLHPWLLEELSANSGIVRFARKFKVLEEKQDPWAAGFWIFNQYCKDPRDYPEDTSLQRKAKRRMVEGLPIGVATGIRL